ncbi:hypothetical protein ANO11243_049430 [Dothideomycetidae sp. 11243]|nr:hypothetical protein ANO11243_049430 [fungal sp. No.11243]
MTDQTCAPAMKRSTDDSRWKPLSSNAMVLKESASTIAAARHAGANRNRDDSESERVADVLHNKTMGYVYGLSELCLTGSVGISRRPLRSTQTYSAQARVPTKKDLSRLSPAGVGIFAIPEGSTKTGEECGTGTLARSIHIPASRLTLAWPLARSRQSHHRQV